jgi:hypothetical protein
MTADPDSPEVLESCPSDVEAAVIVAALGACGVDAHATGGYTAGFRAEAPGTVNVVVRRRDLARAKEVLANIRKTQADVDWSQVDVGDPLDP